MVDMVDMMMKLISRLKSTSDLRIYFEEVIPSKQVIKNLPPRLLSVRLNALVENPYLFFKLKLKKFMINRIKSYREIEKVCYNMMFLN